MRGSGVTAAAASATLIISVWVVGDPGICYFTHLACLGSACFDGSFIPPSLFSAS